MSTPSTQILVPTNHSQWNKPGLLRETAHSRAGSTKVQEEAGTPCDGREQGNTQKMIRTHQKDTEANLKDLLMAKSGTI